MKNVVCFLMASITVILLWPGPAWARKEIVKRDTNKDGKTDQIAPFFLMGPDLKDRQILIDMGKYGTTMVLYMALHQSKELFQALGEVLPQDMPCAVVFWAGYPDRQRILRGTLGDMGEKLKQDKENYMGLLLIGRFLEGAPYEAAQRKLQGERDK